MDKAGKVRRTGVDERGPARHPPERGDSDDLKLYRKVMYEYFGVAVLPKTALNFKRIEHAKIHAQARPKHRHWKPDGLPEARVTSNH